MINCGKWIGLVACLSFLSLTSLSEPVPPAAKPPAATTKPTPASGPALPPGRLTYGPPAAELLAQIAVRLDDRWYISRVECNKSQDWTMRLYIHKWPATAAEFRKKQFDEVVVDLSRQDIDRPLAEVLKRVSSTKAGFTYSPGTPRAAQFELLEKPAENREILQGFARLGVELQRIDNGVCRPNYMCTISNRRTKKAESFSLHEPFTATEHLQAAHNEEVLVVARSPDYQGILLFVPVSLLPRAGIPASKASIILEEKR